MDEVELFILIRAKNFSKIIEIREEEHERKRKALEKLEIKKEEK